MNFVEQYNLMELIVECVKAGILTPEEAKGYIVKFLKSWIKKEGE